MATQTSAPGSAQQVRTGFLRQLGIEPINPGACYGPGGWIDKTNRELLVSFDPSTGEPIASVSQANEQDDEQVLGAAHDAFMHRRTVPGPTRGPLGRELADALRE